VTNKCKPQQMRPLASGRPHPPTPPSERLGSTMIKVGFALWCFFFGYFAGIFHNGTMYALGPSPQGATVPPPLSWPPSTASPTAHARIVEEETAHLPAATFPLCNGQTEKDDALALYRKGLLKQPPSAVVDPVVLRTCRETRKSIQQGIRPAAVAHQRVHPRSLPFSVEGTKAPSILTMVICPSPLSSVTGVVRLGDTEALLPPHASALGGLRTCA
jgi:hypothetical protein